MTNEVATNKHTPSWGVEKIVHPQARVDADEWILVDNDTHLAFGHVFHESRARLAAAAPALLEALVATHTYFIRGGPKGGFSFFYCSLCNRESVTLDEFAVRHKKDCLVGGVDAAIALTRGDVDEARSEHEQIEGFLQGGAR